MDFAGVAVVAAGRPSQQGSVFECDESPAAMYSMSFDPCTPPPPLSPFRPSPERSSWGSAERSSCGNQRRFGFVCPSPSGIDVSTLTQLLTRYPAPSSLPHPLLPPLEHARLHLIPPCTPAPPFSPSSPLPLLLPPRPPPSRGAIRAVPRNSAEKNAPPPSHPCSPVFSLPPLPPHVSSPPPAATAPSARYLAEGNLWEQLSKARLHLAEAMALARHWGRTLVLPRVRSSPIGGNNPPRGMLPACAYFDTVLMGRFVPWVREEYLWRTVVPAWEARGGAGAEEAEGDAGKRGEEGEGGGGGGVGGGGGERRGEGGGEGSGWRSGTAG
ncbi:unnamed protein product [Closterium sp. NIES-53]